MRRHIALGLVAALLIVSGAPLVSAADICALDAGNKKLTQHQHADHTIQMYDEQHGPVMDLSGDTCRIECACGCHSGVDSLPNLLAPHAPCVQSSALVTPDDVAIALPFPELTSLAPVVITPPPRNV